MSLSLSIFGASRLGVAGLSLLAAGCLVIFPACGGMLADRPMPNAVNHDPQLEAEATRAIRGTRDMIGMDIVGESDQILGARIVSDFMVTQNELTGAPTKRAVNIALIVKKADNTCHWVKVQFSQQHMGGGSYGGLHGDGLLERSGMPCPGGEPTTTTSAPAAAAAQTSPQQKADAPVAAPSDAPSADDAAQIDAIVDGLGAKAAPECKAYVHEVCNRQKGSSRLASCKGYADSMRSVASAAQASSICKSTMDALPPAH